MSERSGDVFAELPGRQSDADSCHGQTEARATASQNVAAVADAGAAGWIAFAVAVWMAWVYLVGFVSSGALLYMAAASLACLVAYTGAAVTQLLRGNLVGGVTWLYFGAFTGAAPAFTYFIDWMALRYGWEVDPRAQGWVWIVVGIVLIMETPIFLRWGDTAAGLSVLGADVGIVALAFYLWGYGVTWLPDVSGWAFFVTGLGAMLSAGAELLGGAGWRLPLGPPLLGVRAASGRSTKDGARFMDG